MSKKEWDPIHENGTYKLNYFRDPERDKKRKEMYEKIITYTKREEYDVFSLSRLFGR